MSRIKIHTCLLCCISLFLVGCDQNNHAQFFGIGTVISVDLRANPDIAKQLVQDLQDITKHDQEYYAWDHGALNIANQAWSKAQCIESLNSDFVSLLTQAKIYNQQSLGLFEPAIAPLVELWGFHDVNKMHDTVPNKKLIENRLVTLSSIQQLEISQKEVCAKQAMQIDLGAIGKGWTASKAVNLLSNYKVGNALIDFGGDLILKGSNASGNAWQIGLRHPDHKEPPARLSLKTKNKALAVFTSGDYERTFFVEGQRYHHILNPRNGYPANELRSVTVVHHNPVLADAAATALFIAGKDWQKVAKNMSINEALVIFPNKRVEITESLQVMTTWLDETYDVHIVPSFDSLQSGY